jgi:hypothetical protein
MRILAGLFVVFLALALIGERISTGEGSLGHYMLLTGRIAGVITMTTWFALWWLSSDRQKK